MRGGMNRLLLRSNIKEPWTTRLELLFMNVKYMDIATSMDGPVVADLGPAEQHSTSLPWTIERDLDLRYYRIQAVNGTGYLVGGDMAIDESIKGPDEPSSFFMM
jgi:hypothetical protein